MKRAFHALTLAAALTLAGFTAASGEDLQLQEAGTSSAAAYTSTCWLTCFSLNPLGVMNYKTFNVTQDACCSGAVLSCPAGSTPTTLAWGEPMAICDPGGEG